MSLFRKTVQLCTHHVSLVPQLVLVGGGCVAGAVYTAWFFYHEVPSDRFREPEPPFKHNKEIPTGPELYFGGKN